MKKHSVLVIATSLLCAQCTHFGVHANDTLWYDRPANIWEEYLPLGNGRLGMMPQGGIATDNIVLNEISMWSGSEADYSNPMASKSLPQIRQLLFEDKNAEAQGLMYQTFVPKKESWSAYGSYQILANMQLSTNLDTTQQPTDYRRQLNMATGVATTEFAIGNNHVRREYFVSRDADVIVIRQQSIEPTDITVRLSRPERATATGSTLYGELDSGQSGVKGVQYIATMEAKLSDGTQQTTDGEIKILGTTDAIIIVSATTSYLAGINYKQEAEQLLHKALATDYTTLLQRHIDAHYALYGRVQLHISGQGDSIYPTDQRLRLYHQHQDPAMAALYYNFGRYSLICSTRMGTLPPNLQGLWANGCSTPWNGDYHTNINVQMNHWLLEQGDLDELYEPLIRLVENSVPSGEKTATDFYGADAKGWVMHMMTNVWHFTAPGEHPSWGATNTGGAWLCQHLWDRYEYTLDTAYLRRIYPIMLGAAQFFESTMVREPKHQWLVTAPSSSPENSFYMQGSTEPISVCMGPTMDTEIIHELYTNVIEAATILNAQDSIVDQLRKCLEQLPPLQISDKGYLMEWLEDYDEVDVHHRHVSHLYALHPSDQISKEQTPDLYGACCETLKRRGDEGTGWSRAWKMNFWTRLRVADKAKDLFDSLLTPAIDSAGHQQSGTFPNLWCSHPPFQLDGNFGGAAAIAEMLLQSRNGYIYLLPAWPYTSKGEMHGMKIKGGATVGMSWDKCKPNRLTIEGNRVSTDTIILPTSASATKISLRQGEKYTQFDATEPICVPSGNEKITIEFEYQ